MQHVRSIVTRRLAGFAGLFIVLAWLLSPAFHLSQHVGRDAKQHQHNEASCPVCQIASHGAMETSGGSPAMVAAAFGEVEFLLPAAAGFKPVPDVRAHGSRGPPSA